LKLLYALSATQRAACSEQYGCPHKKLPAWEIMIKKATSASTLCEENSIVAQIIGINACVFMIVINYW